MRTIALYGGSFDPPHLGHEAVVKALLQLEEIDEIIVMPTYLSPFKESVFADAKRRLEWLREIFSSYERVLVDAFEVQKGEKTPTIKTVEYLLKSYECIYVVIGADMLESLQRWHQFDALKRKVNFIVTTRDGIKIPQEFIQLKIDKDISSTALRRKMNKEQLCTINAEEIYNYYKEKNEQ